MANAGRALIADDAADSMGEAMMILPRSTVLRGFGEMEWRIKQDGLIVAGGSADDVEVAKREAARYSIVYAQESPVDLYYREGRHWRKVTRVEFVHSPDTHPKDGDA